MPGEAEASRIVSAVIAGWVEDVESDVEYAELVDGRWAMRMRQTVRDYTTVWWAIGQRSVRAEAYLFPGEELGERPLRLALARNGSTWRTRLALDPEGSLVIRARLANEHLNHAELELTLAEIYEVVEITFPSLLRLHKESPRR